MQRKKLLQAIIMFTITATYQYSVTTASSADFKTGEYYASGGLDLIRAVDAYTKGYNGTGITVGISDLPINFANPELATKMNSYNVDNLNNYDWSLLDHGTHVAGIVAASKDGVGMHGVAFQADVIGESVGKEYFEGGAFNTRSDLYAGFWEQPQVKIINNSWGSFSVDVWCEAEGANVVTKLWTDPTTFIEQNDASYYYNMGQASAQDKLLVFSAGNSGHASPSIENTVGFAYPESARNFLTVVAADNRNLTANADGSISGSRPLAFFSDLPKYVEDSALAAPGILINSADANFAVSGNRDVTMSGTSMASPYVSGVGALVQQAYPDLSAKQIGDVLLSTANSNIELPDYQIQVESNLKGERSLNVFFKGGPNGMSEAELRNLAKAYYQDYYAQVAHSGYYTEANWAMLAESAPIKAYYYSDVQEIWGQGMVDAAKAVRGPSALNARRLTAADISTAYTVRGVPQAQALYRVDTNGYNSTWSNDIKEIKVGLLASDSTENDLRDRYRHYDTNWLNNTNADEGITAITQAYVDLFNQRVEASGLKGLSVGLYKEGNGILRLTGANTYEGATVSAGGVLQIDGSVAGDAYTTSSGTLAGAGLTATSNIKGNVYNSGALLPGSYAVDNVYDTNPIFTVGTLTIGGKLTSNGYFVIGVDTNNNSSKVEITGKADITDSKISSLVGYYPLIGNSYEFLKADSITGNWENNQISPYISIAGSTSGNVASFTANKTRELQQLPGLTSSQVSIAGALENMATNLLNIQTDSKFETAKKELLPLYYQDGNTSRQVQRSITKAERTDLLIANAISGLTTRAAFTRLDTPVFAGNMQVSAPVLSIAGNNWNMPTSVPFTMDANNNLWLQLLRGNETFDGIGGVDSLHNKTFGGVIGYDQAINNQSRFGGLFSYGKTEYSTENLGGNSHDWRIGFYGNNVNGDWQYQGIVTYGENNYDLQRHIIGGISALDADYKARVWGVEVKAQYTVPSTKGKMWEIKPYGDLSFTHTAQDGYSESGTSLFAQNIASAYNASLRGEIGLELKRALGKDGGLGGSLGYKRILSGINTELNGSFANYADSKFTITGQQDRNYFTYSINAYGPMSGNWTLQGEIKGERSNNYHNELYSVMAKYSF